MKLEGSIALNKVHVVALGTTSYTLRCGVTVIIVANNDFKSDILTEKLFLNPSKNGVFQLYFLKPFKYIKIQVNGISGQLIKSSSYKNVNKAVTIDLSQYPTGISIINIISDGKRLSLKKAIRG